MTLLRSTTIGALALIALTATSEARPRHHHSYGACDGIHRCTCGSTQARHFGFPRMFHGHNLWQAREWGRAFPHTSLRAGVVGVKPHHVYRVVQVIGSGRALVTDEKGTYERRVAGDTFVDPNGNSVTFSARTY